MATEEIGKLNTVIEHFQTDYYEIILTEKQKIIDIVADHLLPKILKSPFESDFKICLKFIHLQKDLSFVEEILNLLSKTGNFFDKTIAKKIKQEIINLKITKTEKVIDKTVKFFAYGDIAVYKKIIKALKYKNKSFSIFDKC